MYPPISLSAQSGKDKKKKELFFYFHPISFVTKRDGVDGREKSRGVKSERVLWTMKRGFYAAAVKIGSGERRARRFCSPQGGCYRVRCGIR